VKDSNVWDECGLLFGIEYKIIAKLGHFYLKETGASGNQEYQINTGSSNKYGLILNRRIPNGRTDLGVF
jgi:hypothetical protein